MLFQGHSDKEKFVEDGRFVITKLFVKEPSGSSSARDTAASNENENFKVVSKEVLEGYITKDLNILVYFKLHYRF